MIFSKPANFCHALETTRTLDFEKENSYDLEIEACEKYSKARKKYENLKNYLN